MRRTLLIVFVLLACPFIFSGSRLLSARIVTQVSACDTMTAGNVCDDSTMPRKKFLQDKKGTSSDHKPWGLPIDFGTGAGAFALMFLLWSLRR